MYSLLNLKAFGDDIDVEPQLSMYGRQIHKIVFLSQIAHHSQNVVDGCWLEPRSKWYNKFKRPCMRSLNFQVSQYVSFITSNSKFFVHLCESQIL